MLVRMSRKQSEMEGRLDDMLSRIAMETQEIKELEQQLTDGQILVNESLQKDLEKIICGLQEYLKGLREQAHRSQQQVLSLQTENRSLQTANHSLQTENQSLQTENHSLQIENQSLQIENQSLQTENHSLQTANHSLQTENRSLQTANHSLQTENQSLQTENHSLQIENQSLQIENQSLQTENHSLQTENHSLQTENQSLQTANHSLQTENRSLQTANHSLQTENQSLQIENQSLQTENHSLQIENQSLQTENHSLQLHLEDTQGHCRQLEDRTRTLRRNVSIQQEQLSVLQMEVLYIQQLSSQSNGHQSSIRSLNRKLRQLSRSMCDSDQLTAEQLRALNRMVELHTHTQIDGSFHRPEGERSEHAVDRTQGHRRRQKPDRTRTRTRDPGHTAPSLASLGTQDSGLGLQYLTSPERGRPTGGGYQVYVAPTHTDSEWRDSGGESDAYRNCRGRTPPPLAAAVSAGQTPLVGPAWLLCNIPEHRDTGDSCVCECLHKEAERLEEEKKLRLETKHLRHTLRQHRSVMQVCDEVECVEKTLLKRRAELRQADRLLLEAQSFIHSTRDKVSSAQDSRLLEDTQLIRALQQEVEELRRRRREEEQSLRETKQEVRSREEELQQLSTKIHSASHGGGGGEEEEEERGAAAQPTPSTRH